MPDETLNLDELERRVEQGWEYHSDLGLPITPQRCESGLTVTEARRLIAIARAAEEWERAWSVETFRDDQRACEHVARLDATEDALRRALRGETTP